jgi:hypothetical protein
MLREEQSCQLDDLLSNLVRILHRGNHRFGDEVAWWGRQGIDPVGPRGSFGFRRNVSTRPLFAFDGLDRETVVVAGLNLDTVGSQEPSAHSFVLGLNERHHSDESHRPWLV